MADAEPAYLSASSEPGDTASQHAGLAPLLTELMTQQCHYPVTDDLPFRFCAAATEPLRAYCPAHHRVVYIPSAAPKKAKKPHRGGFRFDS